MHNLEKGEIECDVNVNFLLLLFSYIIDFCEMVSSIIKVSCIKSLHEIVDNLFFVKFYHRIQIIFWQWFSYICICLFTTILSCPYLVLFTSLRNWHDVRAMFYFYSKHLINGLLHVITILCLRRNQTLIKAASFIAEYMK